MANEDKKDVDPKEKVNQPKNAPIAPSQASAPSLETLSHQWQENSPAINTNVVAGYAAASQSGLHKIDTPENLEKRKQADEVAAQQRDAVLGDDYNCAALDVSDARYCHPGSPRHLAWLKAHGKDTSVYEVKAPDEDANK